MDKWTDPGTNQLKQLHLVFLGKSCGTVCAYLYFIQVPVPVPYHFVHLSGLGL